MSDPAWSQAFILQDGANFTFPNFQTCTHANTGSCQITALSAIKSTAGWTYYEVHCTVDNSTTYIGVGFLAESIALQTTQNIRSNPSQGSCSWVEDHSGGASGGVYNNGSEVLSGPNLPNPTFVIGVLVNGTEGIWGYTVDGTNWNGTNTAAQIVAGTGAITMGYAGPYLPFISAQDYEGSNVAFTASIYASSANCTYALPTGAAYLAASPILTVSSATCLPGDAVQIDWTAANTPVPAGLNYLLDSGSPTACSGSVTGTAGTAIGPTLSSGFHSIAIQDPASLSESNWTGFYVAAPPSGAGTLVYQSSGTSLSSVAVTFTVDLPDGFVYDFYMQAQSTSGTIQLTGGNDFGISATGTQVPDYVTGGGFSNPALPDYTAQNQNGWIGVAPATGPTYVSVTTTTSVQGSLALVEGEDGKGTITASVTNNGTVSTYLDVVTNYAPFANGLIDSSTIFPGHDTTYSYYLAVYTPAGPQTLTITSGSYSSGTLSVAGQSINSALLALDISKNAGSSFSGATSLTVAGDNYAATLAGELSDGSYVLQTKDADTGVTSNFYTLTVSAAETLVLSTGSLTASGTLALGGTVQNADLSLVNVGVDGTFTAGSGLSSSGSVWSVSGGALSPGTYTLQAQDGLTGSLSNTLGLVVSDQQLTLTTVSGTLGGILSFGGTSTNGTSSAIDLEVNGTWGEPGTYTAGTSFTGSRAGTISAYGTYAIAVRDHTNQYVVSNTLDLAVVPSESITLTSATGTFGGALVLAGTTAGASPAGLNVSLNAGGSYAPTAGYSDTSGTFTARGTAPLGAGTFVVQVQDGVYPSIVSNALTLAVAAPAESISLLTATGLANTPLALTGSTANGPAAALDVTLDGGATWRPSSAYTSSDNTLTAPWTASGAILSPGGYYVGVRDDANPDVISNFIALTVAPATSGGGTGTLTGTSFGLSPNGRTIFLVPGAWDWCLDTDGNIAVANDPYATAQDVSSACRLFLGELWYNTDAGVPYFGQILGQEPSVPFIASKLQTAALSVPTVVTAKAVITSIKGRTVTGQVQFTQSNGTTQTVSL
jgi:hypothetical protein